MFSMAKIMVEEKTKIATRWIATDYKNNKCTLFLLKTSKDWWLQKNRNGKIRTDTKRRFIVWTIHI